MIVVTGAAGFIGSVLVSRLNKENFKDIILVDDFTKIDKAANLEGKIYTAKIHRKDFFSWLNNNHKFVQLIFHIGARTDTTEFNRSIFDELNFRYSQNVWKACVKYGLPLIYASSAATYGNGEFGYNDDEILIPKLKPLNPYGESKNNFDLWALKQISKPYFWTGLKFFNVFGPNEYHKERMASVVFHAYNQIKATGKMKLFRSHKESFADGEQKRDFIYVKDVIDVLFFLMYQRKNSGIYNLGTGKARTFIDLVNATFKAMKLTPVIKFIDTPIDIRDKYQYFTEAKMDKLRTIGYITPFTSLEDAINDYVNNFLSSNSRL
ncbi:MAG: ADP-glyceromanno-heptose 6-epimerase [Bacteroidetes bacterium CG23_combo_of_CG06-09_8_20_14_all_32_9]|nr:MAG: ADP-glyceromanno-heptose 6-epimerase [Bacteroidetes bacterium CG23_combo_of_CG06-09_8_20_14_all_32_9]